MRYNRFTDRPRNVGLLEYRRYLNQLGLCCVLLLIAFALLAASLLRWFDARTWRVFTTPPLTVSQALIADIEPGKTVSVTGFLTTDAPVFMPGDDAPLISGRLELIAYARVSPRSTKPSTEVELLSWQDTAHTVFLSDGIKRLTLALPANLMPHRKRPGVPRVKVAKVEEAVRAAGGAQTNKGETQSQPEVHMNFGGLSLPVPMVSFPESLPHHIRGRAQREELVSDTQVTVFAALDDLSGIRSLVAPAAERAQITRGAPSERRQGLLVSSVVMPLFALGLGFGAMRALRRARTMREMFRVRSLQ